MSPPGFQPGKVAYSMAVDLPTQDPVALESYEPERYYAVWQHPERRYAYMIGLRRDAWLICMDSQEAGEAYLRSDAMLNSRPASAYRLDELTLPDAFAAARAQPLPFKSSQGTSVRSVLGVQLRTSSPLGTKAVRNIPL